MTGLTRAQELERLSGQGPSEPPPGLLPFEIDATTDGDAAAVLARVREVLAALIGQDPHSWPELEGWSRLLPGWFVAASAAEESAAERQARGVLWASLSPDERDEAERNERWSLDDFLYWFEPENRQWWWWGAEILGPGKLRAHLVAEDRTVADEALQWLFRAAGAHDVVNQNLRRLRGLG